MERVWWEDEEEEESPEEGIACQEPFLTSVGNNVLVAGVL